MQAIDGANGHRNGNILVESENVITPMMSTTRRDDMTRENNCKERLLLTETGMLEWVGGQGHCVLKWVLRGHFLGIKMPQ